jgi:hypothetical protein
MLAPDLCFSTFSQDILSPICTCLHRKKFIFYLHTKFLVLRSNDSIVFTIKCTDNMCCYFIFYRTNCLNESLIFFEDLLPHKFSGCCISAPVMVLVSHFANFRGRHVGVNYDNKLINTKKLDDH